MANQGEFSAGGVTRVTSLPVPVEGLRGEIVYLSQQDGGYTPGLYKLKETELAWVNFGSGSIGQVYITNATPLTLKNVSFKVTEADGHVLTQFRTDHQIVVVHVRAIAGPSGYKPSVKVNGVDVTNLTLEGSGPEWNGSVQITLPLNILYPSLGTISADHIDGAKAVCFYELKLAPTILSAVFSGSYPANPDNPAITQTELKQGDTFSVSVTTNVPMSHIEVQGSGASSTLQLLAAPSEGTSGTFTFTVGDRGNSPSNQGLFLRARDADGSFGDMFSIIPGGLNGVNQVVLNNVTPTLAFSAPAYPASQQALKGLENASITLNASGHDLVIPPVFVSSTGELNVSAGAVNSAFIVSRISGGYNVATNNITATVFRSSNGRKSTVSTLVKIADADPTIVVSESSSRLRSGGSHGTTAQNYTVTVASTQQFIEAPSLEVSSGGNRGTFTTAFSGSGSSYSRTIRIADTDLKGDFAFEGLAVKNLAGKTTYLLSGDLVYTLGGFVRRTISVPGAFTTSVAIGTPVVSTGKLSCYHYGKDKAFTYSATDSNQLDKFIIDNSNTWRCLDQAFNQSNATGYLIELEELV